MPSSPSRSFSLQRAEGFFCGSSGVSFFQTDSYNFRSNIFCLSPLKALFQPFQNLLIRRAERIRINLIHSDPTDVVMLQFLGDSLSDGSMEQCQMNCQIRVFVRDIHEYLAHIQRDGQFLLTFPNERLLLGFAWLYLATYKLP